MTNIIQYLQVTISGDFLAGNESNFEINSSNETDIITQFIIQNSRHLLLW